MARRLDPNRLMAIMKPPSEGDFEWRCNAEASVEFLKVNAQSDEVVIYAIGPAMLIHGVLAPRQSLRHRY